MPWPTPSPSSTPARRASSSRCSTRGDGSSTLVAARPDRRPLHRAALRRQGRARASVLDEKSWDEGDAARPRRRARPPRRRSCARSCGGDTLAGVGHRVVHGGHAITRSRCASTPTVLDGAREVRAARAAAPAAQPGADPARCSSAGPSCRRSPASTPPSIAPSRRSRRCSRCRASCTDARRAALRLPRPVLRVHRLGAAAARCARPRRPHRRRCTSATARACARMRGGPQRRQHDGLHRGRRAADGHALRRARSRACMLYLMDERGMDARAIEKLIYKQSGLLGVSGISSDMRTLLASDDAARAARDRPVRLPHRARARLAGRGAGRPRCARLHRPASARTARAIRERVCRDAALARRASSTRRPTRSGGPRISAAGSRVVGLGDPDQRGADDRPPHAALVFKKPLP